jgi:spore germination protein KB
MEKGKISAFQMGIIMYPTVLATAILFVPTVTAKLAERDLWLTPIWASLIGFITVFIVIQLNKLFPEKTIIEYTEQILGRFIGKVFGWVYLVFTVYITSIVIREYGEFMVGIFLNNTPLAIVIGSMVLVCAFNVRGGIEVIGRSAQIFVPIVLLLYLCLVLLLIPDLKVEHMLPVFEHGIIPSLKGSLVVQGWFSEFILIAFLLPFMTNRNKGMKWGIISIIAITATLVITNIASYCLFGIATSTIVYPVMIAARFISIADFFEHLEALAMMIWVGGTFVKISMFYYAITLGTAQLLKLSDFRPLTLPIGFILILASLLAASNLQVLVHFVGTSSPFYFLVTQTAFPLLLLLVAWVRKSVSAKRRA